jgi:hypothetical protein
MNAQHNQEVRDNMKEGIHDLHMMFDHYLLEPR